MRPGNPFYAQLARQAEKAALIGGKVVMSFYRQAFQQHEKNDHTPVTVADQRAEQAIRRHVTSLYPSHGFVGEEFGAIHDQAEYVWVVDPIDGTKSFITGRPIFGMLIGVLHRGYPVVGVLHQPVLKEMWTGISGQHTSMNGKPVKTSLCTELSQAVLATTSPDLFSAREKMQFGRLLQKTRFCQYGGDCYNYGLLSLGMVDIVAESGLKLHDFCALVPIIEGAGGIVTDWYGNRLNTVYDGSLLATSTVPLHQKVLDLLQPRYFEDGT